MLLQHVTRVSYQDEKDQGKERDRHSSSWDWSAGVVHVAQFQEYQDFKPPATLCGLNVWYQRITSGGTPAGFQWCFGAASERQCEACAALLNGRVVGDRAHTVTIPDADDVPRHWR